MKISDRYRKHFLTTSVVPEVCNELAVPGGIQAPAIQSLGRGVVEACWVGLVWIG